MDRKKELLNLINKDDVAIKQLVDEIVFIESRLIELKKLPFISINPRNPAQQKATAASRQYRELLQQYTNCLKVLLRMNGDDDSEGESPLRKWAREFKGIRGDE